MMMTALCGPIQHFKNQKTKNDDCARASARVQLTFFVSFLFIQICRQSGELPYFT